MTDPAVPDLRTLAAEAILRADMAADLSDLDDDEQVDYFNLADAALSVLPAHRAMVLEEAAGALIAAGNDPYRNAAWMYANEAADMVRRLAASTPPARQDSPGTTGQAGAGT